MLATARDSTIAPYEPYPTFNRDLKAGIFDENWKRHFDFVDDEFSDSLILFYIATRGQRVAHPTHKPIRTRLEHSQLCGLQVNRLPLLEAQLIKLLSPQFHIHILLIVGTLDFQAHQ